MKIFFDDFEILHRFTLNLRFFSDSISCHFCLKSDHLISHGCVYKKQYNGQKKTVGKRIFCSNRSNSKGCGRTIRLYLSDVIPNLQYSTSALTSFLSELIKGTPIDFAYKIVTRNDSSRNAYRWLNKFIKKITDYRKFIFRDFDSKINNISPRTPRLDILLETINRLFSIKTLETGQLFQTHSNQVFL
jgi:hypothetical protein